MMQNLRDVNIRSVAVIGEFSADESGYKELSDVLGGHQENWPRRRIDKLGFYEVDGVRHHIDLDLEASPKLNPDVAVLRLEAHPFSTSERLSASTRRKQELHFHEIQAILSDIEALNLSGRLHSHIVWLFQPGSKKPIIGLPMMTIQNPNIPFTEISGISLRKVTGESRTTVTIDLRRDRSLVVALMTPLIGATISQEIIDYTAQQGTKIISDFILDIGTPLENGDA